MEKINFENYPSTNSPINGTNLNLLQDNVEDAINEKNTNIITASFSENYTLVNNGSYEVLFLNNAKINGSAFSLQNDGGILIGEGVSKIKISFKCHYNSIILPGSKWVSAFVNDVATCAICQQLSNRASLTSSTEMIDVQPGDIIYLKVNGSNGDIIRADYTYSNITIEKVN